MNILLLGEQAKLLGDFIRAYGDTTAWDQPTDWIFSFGHREIISKNTIEAVGGRAINLHLGALPWNRGANPNFHAWRDGTPHGVTLHYITPELDAGPIIAQRRVHFQPGETLRTSYMRLDAEARALFMEYWPELRRGPRGSLHKKSDMMSLKRGWDTEVVWLQH